MDRTQLDDFTHIHRNRKIVVCGCGTSLNLMVVSPTILTIGISDVGRLFTPNYLVVQNYKQNYNEDRFQYILNSQASYCFTPLIYLMLNGIPMIRFRASTYGGVDWLSAGQLPYSSTSAYMALCLAARMGANPIGLIGVDFTEDHFFAKTGVHRLTAKIDKINNEFIKLNHAFLMAGIEVHNLSHSSKLTAFPKTAVETFLR